MLHNPQNNKTTLLLLLTTILFTQGQCGFISMTVNADIVEINAAATYTFVINRQYDPVNFQFVPSPAAVPLNS